MTKRDDTSRAADLARYYDLDLRDDPGDVPMYLELAGASPGPVLELAAGSGRICVALAAAGHDVTGVDRDPDMLDRARSAWRSHTARAGGGSLHLVQGDLLELRLEGSFNLVILALNSLLLLPGRSAQQAALQIMARHLAPLGRAVIDVWLPTPDDLALYDGRMMLDWIRRDPETAESVAKRWSASYDARSNTAVVETVFEATVTATAKATASAAVVGEEPSRRTSRRDEISFIAVGDLLGLAERAGLAVETLAGDYALGPIRAVSDRAVLVCRPSGR